MSNTRIIQLTAENFKRLEAIELAPDGTFNLVSGNNEQGKSSLLDAIAWAIGGSKAIKSTTEPIRRGQKRAEVTIDLGDLVLTRTITAAGERLQVAAKDGAPMKSPQAVLDALRGKISFDPLEFIQLSEAEQTKTLLTLVGVDVAKFEKERKEIFDNRTISNRDLKKAKANLESAPVPAKPESFELKTVTEVTNRLAKAQELISGNKAKDKEITDLRQKFDDIAKEINDLEQQIAILQTKLTTKMNEKETVRQKHNATKAEVRNFVAPDITAIQDEISGIEMYNDAIRSYNSYLELQGDYNKYNQESENYTKQLNGMDAELVKKITEAKMPITGLSVVDSVVRYNDVPLSQCSQAIRVKVSMAIAMAMNPRLRVILIREGALFDNKNLKLIADMAKDNNFQIWVERVGEGETGIIIENGEVKTAPAPKKQTKKPEPKIEEFPVPADEDDGELL